MSTHLGEQEPAALRQLLEQRTQQLAALHASTSWRLTAPLRWVTGAAKRLLKTADKSTKLPATPTQDYAQWVRDFDSPNEEVCANLRAQVDGFPTMPMVSILMPCNRMGSSN